MFYTVFEVCVTQSVSKFVQRLLVEIAIGFSPHIIFVKCRNLIDAFVKCKWQTTRRIIVAKKNIGNGSTASLTRIPGFENGRYIFCFPVEEYECTLKPNARFIICSDGALEPYDGGLNEQFEQLLYHLQHQSFQAPEHVADDIAILSLRRMN